MSGFTKRVKASSKKTREVERIKHDFSKETSGFDVIVRKDGSFSLNFKPINPKVGFQTEGGNIMRCNSRAVDENSNGWLDFTIGKTKYSLSPLSVIELLPKDKK